MTFHVQELKTFQESVIYHTNAPHQPRSINTPGIHTKLNPNQAAFNHQFPAIAQRAAGNHAQTYNKTSDSNSITYIRFIISNPKPTHTSSNDEEKTKTSHETLQIWKRTVPNERRASRRPWFQRPIDSSTSAAHSAPSLLHSTVNFDNSDLRTLRLSKS